MLNSQQEHESSICIGVITAVNGVKGYVKVRSFTAKPEDITSFDRVFDDYGKVYELKIITLKKDYVIVSIEGISSRNDAEKLRNTKLYIARTSLPEVSNDEEYYHADLVAI